MSSPSALIKVNYLVIRYLHFGSVLGDLQEGNGCASRCQFTLFSSTKTAFLCAFGLRDPRFRAFRAQNRGFCAFLAFGPLVFGHFEHKIEVFVRFGGWEPSFSGISSTKSGFLCAFASKYFPDGTLGQQQTSSGGEKYSGLASNLAHLGRIC